MVKDWRDELEHWLAPFVAALKHKTRGRMCPAYIVGLIGPGDRKSVQPMAARDAGVSYDQLHHFIANGVWDAAPLAGIVCMHQDLGPADAVSVGVYLQTLMLALTARGLGSRVEVSVAGYPDVVRTELKIPQELTIMCGLAVGYTDPDFPTNKLRIRRDPVEKNVRFLDD